MEKERKVIRGYKGFDKELKCLDFQYEVGKEYECDKAVACEEGFHFCENPLDVLRYYPPSSRKGLNRFCEVEGSVEFDLSEGDKICCSKIKIIREMTIQELIEEGVKRMNDNGSEKCSVAAKTGCFSVVANIGKYSAATNTGNYSSSTNTGEYSTATNTGFFSAATNTGEFSAAINTGALSSAVGTGNDSVAVNTGSNSVAIVSGEESVAMVTGKDCKAKGALGCWIVLTERDGWNGEKCPIKDVKAFKVDGEKIKPDTFYQLMNGEAVEVTD